MPKYDSSHYFQILTVSIRPNVEIPFDCYLLLEKNENIFCIVKRNSSFPAEKINKLFDYEFSKLYITNEDKESYFGYLNEFLESEAGQEYLKKQDSQSLDNLIGIPKADEFHIDAIHGNKKNYGSVVVEDAKQKIAGKPEIYNGITKLLRQTAKDADEKIQISGSLREEEKITIRDATLKISESLIAIPENPKTPGEFVKIKRHLKEILDELKNIDLIIKDKTGHTKEILEKIVSRLKESLDPLMQIKGKKGLDDSKIVVKDSVQQIRNENTSLISIVDTTGSKLLENSINILIKAFENNSGIPIPLQAGEHAIVKDPKQLDAIATIWHESLTYKNYVEMSQSENVKAFQPLFIKIMANYSVLSNQICTETLTFKGVDKKESEEQKSNLSSSEINQKIESLEIKNKELLKKIEYEEKKSFEFESSLKDKQIEVDNLKNETEKLQKELHILHENPNAPEALQSIQLRLKEKEKIIFQMEKDHSDEHNELIKLRTEASEFKLRSIDTEGLKRDMTLLLEKEKTENSQLRQTVKNYEQRIGSLSSNLEESKKSTSKDGLEIDELRDEKTKAVTLANKLTLDLKETNSKLNRMSSQIEALEQQKSQLERKFEDEKKYSKDQERVISQKTTEIQNLNKQLKLLQAQIEKLEDLNRKSIK